MTMVQGDVKKTDRRARIGLEDLEGRNLQSALAADTGALVRPTEAPAYHTTVWEGSAEDLAQKKLDPPHIKIDTGDAFASIKGESGFASVKLGEGAFLSKKAV
jgi:hypothetical protein